MAILIEGMEMPKSCDVCDFAVELDERELGAHLYCGFPGIGVYVDDCVFSVHKDCPLVEIQPHGRLIDADELQTDYFVPSTTSGTPNYYYVSKKQIDDLLSQGWVDADAPTIIPAEEDE